MDETRWVWAVGVTTAPRPQSTLVRTVRSLRAAGFGDVEVFEDTTRAGAWPTWVGALAALVGRVPTATAYLMVQDDTVFCPGLRDYLERTLWPSDRTAVCSPYCPAPYRARSPGWHRENRGWDLVGALCWAIPPAAARLMLQDLAEVRARQHVDARVGLWAARQGRDVWYHTPSLAQHIGNGNSALGDQSAGDLRRASDFIGETTLPHFSPPSPDPTPLLPPAPVPFRIATVCYRTENIGDDIQSAALERLLPRVDLRVDRDDMAAAREWGEDVRWVLNGWYSADLARVWPPPGRARRLFVGFHALDERSLPPTPDLPVGCRDPWTLRLCGRRGVAAWLSHCATLTLDRPAVPRGDEVLLVDVPPPDLRSLPTSIASGTRLTDRVRPDCDRAAEASLRLDLYARARWVVTSRLQALLACAAMGTPVAFIRRPDAGTQFTGYTHLGWAVGDAPWDAPRPRVPPEAVRETAQPLADAVRRFVSP